MTALEQQDMNALIMDVTEPLSDWAMLVDEPPTLTPVYRMPERDKTGTHSLNLRTLKEGDCITFSRVVVRVGYEIGVHSVTRAEWFEAGAKLLAERTGQSVETIKQIILEMNLSSPFRGLKKAIYDALIDPMISARTTPEHRNVRAMWFYDCPEPQAGTVVGTVIKLTGKREPGGQSGYYGEDYDPPCLYKSRRQLLYKVRNRFSDYRDVLVYPADAIAPEGLTQ